MSDGFLFASESVSEGHPDKVADQVSDAVLDAAYGHFGRELPEFTWERTDMAKKLAADC